MQWNKLTKKSMPPINETVLLWRGIRDSDGGFPCVAKHCRVNGEEYIRWRSYDELWQKLKPEEYRATRWAMIPKPEI